MLSELRSAGAEPTAATARLLLCSGVYAAFVLCDYQQALEYYQRLVHVRRVLYGEEHPTVAAALCDVAVFYRKLGKYDQALEYEKHALELRKTLFPPNHADVASSLNSVGCAYCKLGRYEEGLEYG